MRRSPVSPSSLAILALLSAAVGLDLGDTCSRPTNFREAPGQNECRVPGVQNVFCLNLDGENRCLQAQTEFLGTCGLANSTGCVKDNIGLGRDVFECSAGRCASVEGQGKICQSDADCPSTDEQREELGERCVNGNCFKCVEMAGEKRCRVNANMGDRCVRDVPSRFPGDFALCTEGLECDMEAEGANEFFKTGICVNPNEPPGVLGSNCFATGIRCPAEEGLFCIRNRRGPPQKTCVKLAKLGEFCNEAEDAPLDQRVLCNLPDDNFPQVPYVCRNNVCSEPPAEAGAPCNVEMGFDCDDGCAEEGTVVCQRVNDPTFQQQKVDRCVAFDIPEGEPCQIAPFGVFNLCVKGTGCKPPPFPFPSGFASGTCEPTGS